MYSGQNMAITYIMHIITFDDYLMRRGVLRLSITMWPTIGRLAITRAAMLQWRQITK
jgi:hypothetical protein